MVVCGPDTACLPCRVKPLSVPLAVGVGALAAVAYWLAFATPTGAAGVLVGLPCVCLLGRLGTARRAFYGGLLAGVAMYAPPLAFFYQVFGPNGTLLWLIAGIPVGAFVLLVYHARRRLGEGWAVVLTPILWTGVEYFRSELYALRFAWLLPAQAPAFLPGVRLLAVGVYGLGFTYAVVAAMVVGRHAVARIVGCLASLALAVLMYWPALPASPQTDAPLHVAGVQLEGPGEWSAATALDRLATAHPEAQVLVLSEYTFHRPVPAMVREVVRKHRRYLVAGGIKERGDGRFYDTAFVIGPDGREVFEQGKSVPVQFMADGLPAEGRRVWESPWGRIGIAVCYDVSYARVMDDFIRQGAGGLIVPTMDLASWGGFERRMLHGRLAPVRSAEYGVPVFGVWSSGESQLTDRQGRVIARAGYPGQGEMIAGAFDVRQPGRVPPDRPLAMAATLATGAFILYLLIWRALRRRGKDGARGDGSGRDDFSIAVHKI
ncbi:MAG: nit2 [Phycisphaerales bacterium]|nr:nit2 [Phycisphaerales bacterium]